MNTWPLVNYFPSTRVEQAAKRSHAFHEGALSMAVKRGMRSTAAIKDGRHSPQKCAIILRAGLANPHTRARVFPHAKYYLRVSRAV